MILACAGDGCKPYPIARFLDTWSNADLFHSLTTLHESAENYYSTNVAHGVPKYIAT